MTPDAVLREGVARLLKAGVPDPKRDASRLLGHAAKGGYLHWDEVPEPVLVRFWGYIADREKRKPVSQIIGRRAFWRHEFQVTEDVLDPRPETETLVEQSLARDFSTILDLGTGSGAILLSVLADRSAARGVGTDLSMAALQVARRNAAEIGVADRATFQQSDWFEGVHGAFDLIVSNPPYIAAEEMDDLAPEVRDWEPRAALTDEADGLSAYRAITTGAPAHLEPGGRLLVEIGWQQGAAVSGMFADAGFAEITIHPDLDGRDRVVSGTWRGKSA